MAYVPVRRLLYDGKGKAAPVQAWTGPWGFRRFSLPGFLEDRHTKVARLSDLRTGRLYRLGDIC